MSPRRDNSGVTAVVLPPRNDFDCQNTKNSRHEPYSFVDVAELPKSNRDGLAVAVDVLCNFFSPGRHSSFWEPNFRPIPVWAGKGLLDHSVTYVNTRDFE